MCSSDLILNLYAGVGGNRKYWSGHDVTSVEFDKNIASIYADMYPDDTIIVGDAHQYLMEHYQEFDMIWASPPCQSHSGMRQHLQVGCRGQQAIFPDMKLYQEIIFLQYNFKGLYVVENVKPYYTPLIEPDFILQRHYYWSNIEVPSMNAPKHKLRSAQIPELQE